MKQFRCDPGVVYCDAKQIDPQALEQTLQLLPPADQKRLRRIAKQFWRYHESNVEGVDPAVLAQDCPEWLAAKLPAIRSKWADQWGIIWSATFLTKEEEREILRRIYACRWVVREGVCQLYQRALSAEEVARVLAADRFHGQLQQHLVVTLYPLVVKRVHRWWQTIRPGPLIRRSGGFEPSDFLSHAVRVVVRSIDLYELRRGLRFSTLALGRTMFVEAVRDIEDLWCRKKRRASKGYSGDHLAKTKREWEAMPQAERIYTEDRHRHLAANIEKETSDRDLLEWIAYLCEEPSERLGLRTCSRPKDDPSGVLDALDEAGGRVYSRRLRDHRFRTIARQRLLVCRSQQTGLLELGQQLGLTKERVRQLERDLARAIRRKVKETLGEYAFR